MYANVLIANVMTAINMLQTMRAFVAFGVVMGSVIMKNVNSNNDPFIRRCAQTSMPQPR